MLILHPPPPTAEVDNLCVGYTSQQELLFSNISITISMNVLPENITVGHTSRIEPNDLTIRQDSEH